MNPWYDPTLQGYLAVHPSVALGKPSSKGVRKKALSVLGVYSRALNRAALRTIATPSPFPEFVPWASSLPRVVARWSSHPVGIHVWQLNRWWQKGGRLIDPSESEAPETLAEGPSNPQTKMAPLGKTLSSFQSRALSFPITRVAPRAPHCAVPRWATAGFDHGANLAVEPAPLKSLKRVLWRFACGKPAKQHDNELHKHAPGQKTKTRRRVLESPAFYSSMWFPLLILKAI